MAVDVEHFDGSHDTTYDDCSKSKFWMWLSNKILANKIEVINCYWFMCTQVFGSNYLCRDDEYNLI